MAAEVRLSATTIEEGNFDPAREPLKDIEKKLKSCKNTIGFINGPIGVMFFLKHFCCNNARYLYVLRISELISLILAVGWAPVAN